MTEDEARAHILGRMTEDTKKFAIAIDYSMSTELQYALEWLQNKDWIRLIDVSVIAASGGQLMRIFRVMPEAEFWLMLYRRDRA